MEKHTVLPWQFWYKSVFSGADPICRGENDDDLRYIVTACNAYPALVEALENVTATYRTFRNVPKEEQEWTQTDEDALSACFAALALAKEK